MLIEFFFMSFPRILLKSFSTKILFQQKYCSHDFATNQLYHRFNREATVKTTHSSFYDITKKSHKGSQREMCSGQNICNCKSIIILLRYYPLYCLQITKKLLQCFPNTIHFFFSSSTSKKDFF